MSLQVGSPSCAEGNHCSQMLQGGLHVITGWKVGAYKLKTTPTLYTWAMLLSRVTSCAIWCYSVSSHSRAFDSLGVELFDWCEYSWNRNKPWAGPELIIFLLWLLRAAILGMHGHIRDAIIFGQWYPVSVASFLLLFLCYPIKTYA